MKHAVLLIIAISCACMLAACSGGQDEEKPIQPPAKVAEKDIQPLPEPTKDPGFNPLETQVNALNSAKDLQQTAQERVQAEDEILKQMNE